MSESEVNRSGFVSGGYLFIQPTPRTDFLDPQYHPQTILSASKCFCKQAPAGWMFSWCKYPGLDRSAEAAIWAIERPCLKRLAKWMDMALHSGRIAWPGPMFSLGTASEFAGEFLAKTEREFLLVGMSLPHDLVGRLLESVPKPKDVEQYSPYAAVRQGNPPAPGGRVLGYEILGHEYGGSHSWLCNKLVPDCCRKLDMKLDPMGFIDDAELARRAAEHCNGLPSEPIDWLPWLLQSYDIRAS